MLPRPPTELYLFYDINFFTVFFCVVLMFLLWWMCNLNLSFHLDIYIIFYLLKQTQNFSFLLLFHIMVQVMKYSCILVFLLPFSPASISGFQKASVAVSWAGLSHCYPFPPSHRSLTVLMQTIIYIHGYSLKIL